MKNYFIISIQINKETRYIDNRDSKNGTAFENEAKPFETKEEANEFLAATGYVNCYITEYTAENQINVVFFSSESDYEKLMEANNQDEALEIAKNSNNWPLEFSDYSNMKVRISDSEGEAIYTYNELN